MARIGPVLLLAIAMLPAAARAEVYLDVPGTPGSASRGAAETTPRERVILVDGVATRGRDWIEREPFESRAQRLLADLRRERHPLPPRVQRGPGTLTIVRFLAPRDGGAFDPATARARVTIARRATGRGRTALWEAEAPVEALIERAAAAGRGEAPGRDHPVLGAPPASRRVNVVESLGRPYTYSAVYTTSGAPRAVTDALVARYTARGATLDATSDGADEARAALTLHGRRIDVSAARDRATPRTVVVFQTDLPPFQPTPEIR